MWNVISFHTNTHKVFMALHCENTAPLPVWSLASRPSDPRLACVSGLPPYVSLSPSLPLAPIQSMTSVGNIPSVPFPKGRPFFLWLTSGIPHEHCSPVCKETKNRPPGRPLFFPTRSARPRENPHPGVTWEHDSQC